jgi:hypothetical protein
VPSGKIPILLRIIETYANHETKAGQFRNKELVESIEAIRLAAVRDYWQDSPELFPAAGELAWWEIWWRRAATSAETEHARVSAIAHRSGLRVSDRFASFPERLVTHAEATREQIGQSVELLLQVAELRRAKELTSTFVEMPPREQAGVIEEALLRIRPPAESAPAVCLLDTGVNRQHPLLELALSAQDTQSVNAARWGPEDDVRQHGTNMAGISLYGCLTSLFGSKEIHQLEHRLESIKLLPPPPRQNEEHDYGPLTVSAIALAEIQAPERPRAICMAVSADDRDLGLPTMWSATIDQLASGALDDQRRLLFLSAGNIRDIRAGYYRYHTTNRERCGIEDPGQSWNALTVGAFTERTEVRDPAFAAWSAIAPSGDLCPTSRTSLPWPDESKRGWPLKPDLVLEGGNYLHQGAQIDSHDDVALLTTTMAPFSGRLLASMVDTSPATALAARAAAMVWSVYPRLWPETIRGLLVHSARWTPAMIAQFPGPAKRDIQERLRCYGFGVPNLERALWSAENHATLLFEGELQPFHRVKGTVRSNQMHLHSIPWPIDVLQTLGEVNVTLRVTLSYFIEPSPGRRGWDRKHRYQSHGLRFDVIRPEESVEELRQRLSRDAWDDPEERPDNVPETRPWIVGDQGRRHGSIHSDSWTGPAARLASCGLIAVYPVSGWWRERAHLGRVDRRARYSLIVSIEAPEIEVDLYTAIANQATVVADVEAS